MRFLLMAALLLTGCDKTPPKQEVLSFTATWCSPCKKNAPAIRSLIKQGFRIRSVDIDDQPAIADNYGVESVPTYIVLNNGRQVFRTGDVGNLRTFLNRGR